VNDTEDPVADKPMDHYEILMQQLSTVLTRDGQKKFNNLNYSLLKQETTT